MAVTAAGTAVLDRSSWGMTLAKMVFADVSAISVLVVLAIFVLLLAIVYLVRRL